MLVDPQAQHGCEHASCGPLRRSRVGDNALVTIVGKSWGCGKNQLRDEKLDKNDCDVGDIRACNVKAA